MPFKFIESNGDFVTVSFDNAVSFWNLLKYNVEPAYLKHFVIEDYKGGNTVVSDKLWSDEGIVFRKLGENSYFFPYESIGFILDDSIENINMYVIDADTDYKNYKNQYEMIISIKDSDTLTLTFKKDKANMNISLYLLSKSKSGFDGIILKSIQSIIKNIYNPKITEILYIDSSLVFGINGMSFVISISDGNSEKYYKLSYKRKFKKSELSDKEITNYGLIKKKIIDNDYLKILIITIIILFFVALFIINIKLALTFIGIVVLIRLAIYFIKKNLDKIYNYMDKANEPGDKKIV